MKNNSFCLMLSGLLWIGVSWGSQKPIMLKLSSEAIGRDHIIYDSRDCVCFYFEHDQLHRRNKLRKPLAYILEQDVKILKNAISTVTNSIDTHGQNVTMQFHLKNKKFDVCDRLCEVFVNKSSERTLGLYMENLIDPENIENMEDADLMDFYNIQLVKICPNVLALPLYRSVNMSYKLGTSGASYKNTKIERGIAFACKGNLVSPFQALYFQDGELKYIVQHAHLLRLTNLMNDIFKKDTSSDRVAKTKQYSMGFMLGSKIGKQSCYMPISQDTINAINNLLDSFPSGQNAPKSEGAFRDSKVTAIFTEMDDFQVKVEKKNQENKAIIRKMNPQYPQDSQMYIDQRPFLKKGIDRTYTVLMTPTINGEYELFITSENLQLLLKEIEEVNITDQSKTFSIEFYLSDPTSMWTGTYSIEVNEKNIDAIKQCINLCEGKEADFETLKSFAQNMTCSITQFKTKSVGKRVAQVPEEARQTTSSSSVTTRPLAGGKSVTAQQQQTAKQTKVAEQVSGPIKGP